MLLQNVLVCSDRPRLRLTIPREPELETSQRAHRIRSKHITEVGEQVLSATPSFKARTLNRKILSAPSIPFPRKSTPQLPEFQEFHLKTTQRAMQHSSTAPSSLQKISNSDEILSSKGDMGVFRSNKRETTVTMEFSLQTEKRLQQNPPIELLKKLSLKSEPQLRDTLAESMLSRPPRTVLKGSKENIDSLQREQKVTYSINE
ncbi:hypothetical protein ACLOJK_033512 [Asimina triloba]